MDQATSHAQASALQDLYASDAFRPVFLGLRDLLEKRLQTCFGYHLCELSDFEHTSLSDASHINHRFKVGRTSGVIAHSHELPLETESVDVVIAIHSLDTATNPHGTLREIQRILTPQGHLFLICLNPVSLVSIKKWLARLPCSKTLGPQAQLSAHRLEDWMRLLGMERSELRHFGHLPLLERSDRYNRSALKANQWLEEHRMPLGQIYMMHAVKHVSALIKPTRLKMAPKLRAIGLRAPAAASKTRAELGQE
ncbi:MAG: hypothetical protein RI942_1567 [Pseudomonadota bacterium]